jgi:glycosyl transferase family 25
MTKLPVDHIFYINLDHRKDRDLEIQEELIKYDIQGYEKFSGILHEKIGGVGCGKSHVEVLKLAKERGYKSIMILEDDFMFQVSKDEFYNAMENLNQVESFDICLLSFYLIDSRECERYPFLRKVIEAQTTSGYIINEHYYDTLIRIFDEAIVLFENTNYHWLYAIDVAWKQLQIKDNWYCFVPRLGKQRPSYSDCGNTFSHVEW